MRRAALWVGFASIGLPLMGCTVLLGPRASEPLHERALPLRSIDGLARVDLDIPGVLELREDHRIGGYDSVLIPRSVLRYRRGSMRLTRDGKNAFLELVRASLVDATRQAGIPIVDQPGPCTLEVQLDIVRMGLDVREKANHLADMTLVLHLRDSMSGDSLLRYAKRDDVPRPDGAMSDDRPLRRGLDRIVADMNLATVLRPAGLADDALIPGCHGTLAKRGRAAVAR